MGLRNISKYIMDAAQNIFTLSAANTARTTATNVLPTQPVDAAGNVLGRTAANTARTTGTLVDPVQLIDAAGNVYNITAANTARTTGTLVLPVQPVDAAGNIIGMQFKTVSSIIGVFSQNNVAASKDTDGKNITVQCISGNLWINPLATAVADATAIKLTAGQALDLYTVNDLSVISDASGATAQIIVWTN